MASVRLVGSVGAVVLAIAVPVAAMAAQVSRDDKDDDHPMVEAGSPLPGEYVYRTAFSSLPLYDELRISKEQRRGRAVINYPDWPSQMGGPYGGGLYTEEVRDGVAGTSIYGVSIPLKLEDDSTWSHGGYSCKADLHRGLYHVTCFKGTERPTFQTQTKVYVYSKQRGIVAFSSRCAVNTQCWFELKSPKGMLSEVPR